MKPIIDAITALLTGRKALAQELFDEESSVLFERLEDIKIKSIKDFYGQVISSTIGDAYDFCLYLNKKNNIFYSRLKNMGQAGTHMLFKLAGMYHTVCLLCSSDRPHSMNKQILKAFKYIYHLSPRDVLDLSRFGALFHKSRSDFELEFSKFAASRLFRDASLEPSELVYVQFFFLNSDLFMQFKEEPADAVYARTAVCH